jgi:hypothetical protein
MQSRMRVLVSGTSWSPVRRYDGGSSKRPGRSQFSGTVSVRRGPHRGGAVAKTPATGSGTAAVRPGFRGAYLRVDTAVRCTVGANNGSAHRRGGTPVWNRVGGRRGVAGPDGHRVARRRRNRPAVRGESPRVPAAPLPAVPARHRGGRCALFSLCHRRGHRPGAHTDDCHHLVEHTSDFLIAALVLYAALRTGSSGLEERFADDSSDRDSV